MHWKEQLNDLGAKRLPCFFAINYTGNEGVVVPLLDLARENIQIVFPSFTHILPHKKEQLSPIVFHPHHIEKDIYAQAFHLVQQHLHCNDIQLINLTFATPVTANATLSDIFHQAKAKYKIFFQDKWVCFSPEPFIHIRNGYVHTFPMKGTLDAKLPNAAHTLQNNPKEREEHHRTVALLEEDLRLIADQVSVERLMYVEEITTQKGKIIQMSSEIKGKLPENWPAHLGSLLHQILPAGSIVGVPKQKALSLIDAAENYDRGYYTGIAGIFDGQSVDSCVLIRFIEKDGSGYLYKSGGGITEKSQLQKEYEELLQKIYLPIS